MKIGDSVIYIPKHIQKKDMTKFNFNSKGCEYGIISSVNDKFVFVRYVKNGIPQNTAQATNLDDLYYLDGRPLIDDVMEILKKL